MTRKPIPGPPAPKADVSAVQATRKPRKDKSTRSSGAQRRTSLTGKAATDGPQAPVAAVIERAQEMGLLAADTQQVGARLPTRLLEQAKRRTGLASTTALLAFALANVAVEDNFAAAFVAARGKLDPGLDVGF